MGRVSCRSSCNMHSCCPVLKKMEIWWHCSKIRQHKIIWKCVHWFWCCYIRTADWQTGMVKGRIVKCGRIICERCWCILYDFHSTWTLFLSKKGAKIQSHLYLCNVVNFATSFGFRKAVRYNKNTCRRRALAHDTMKLQIIEVATLQDFLFCFKAENGVVEIQ
jgi:hypothetical protein